MTTGGDHTKYEPKLRENPLPFNREREEEAKKFGAAAVIWLYATLSEFGFTASPFKNVKENLSAFGDWWAQTKCETCGRVGGLHHQHCK